MKRRVIFILALSQIIALADFSDPVREFKATWPFIPGDVLYRWDADMDGVGKKEVFLKLKSTYDLNKQKGYYPGWVLYLPNASNTGYVTSRGTEYAELGKAVGVGGPNIDIEAMYCGNITQLGRHGIVTLECDNPYISPKRYLITAYTLEGDHLKRVQLSGFESGVVNPIYEQYLSSSHRTKLKLQEVILDNKSMTDDFVTKYSGAFDSDGTGKLLASADFHGEVPVSDQPEVLVQIIDLALSAKPINFNVICCAASLLTDSKIIWNGRVIETLHIMEKSSDQNVRSCALEVFAQRRKYQSTH
jgi:hypothetical protein